MAATGRLELSFVDVEGNPLTESVVIELRHRVLNDRRRITDADGGQPITITDLHTNPQGLYILQGSAPSYWPVSRFVTIPASGTKREQVVLPIRPDRAQPIFPAYDDLDERVKGVLDRSRDVRGHSGRSGRDLYDALSDESKAGLLNIAKKSLATAFTDGDDLLPHVTLLNVIGDRCFVSVPPALPEQMPQLIDGDLFRSVNGALHEPPDGFAPAGSFKTRDAFGNLQLTFFKSAADWQAEVDIDDAAGLAHVFQVMRNHLTGDPTHPYNIHQILMAHQHLDPGYRLLPKV